MPKCLICASPWHLAVPKMTAEITQVSPKMASENSWGNYYLRTCSQGRCRIAPGHQCGWFWMHLGWILDGFLMDFGWILTQLFRILVDFLQQHLQNANAALARTDLTENVKNMQMYAETCKRKNVKKTHE